MRVALFAPCFVDQLAPSAAIAAVEVLERLGLTVDVPEGAACCGQPPANAGFASAGEAALGRFIETFARYDHIIVVSGSCAAHVRAHAAAMGSAGAAVAAHTTEFCAFLHDVIGVTRLRQLGVRYDARVAVHVGCHALRGLGLAVSSERQVPAMNKVHAVLATVDALTFAPLQRPDECCGFGGGFSLDEGAVSARMGRDRLHDMQSAYVSAVVSTDVSCLMHLSGLDRGAGGSLPMWHVAEVLAGTAGAAASAPPGPST